MKVYFLFHPNSILAGNWVSVETQNVLAARRYVNLCFAEIVDRPFEESPKNLDPEEIDHLLGRNDLKEEIVVDASEMQTFCTGEDSISHPAIQQAFIDLFGKTPDQVLPLVGRNISLSNRIEWPSDRMLVVCDRIKRVMVVPEESGNTDVGENHIRIDLTLESGEEVNGFSYWFPDERVCDWRYSQADSQEAHQVILNIY